MFKEFEAKTEEEARNKAIEELGLQGGDFDVEILENVKKGLFKKPLCRIRVYYGEDEEEKEEESFEDKIENEERAEKGSCLQPISDVERKTLEFLNTLIEKMGYEVAVEVMFREEKKIGIKLTSESSSILIGRKGKNLDAMQLLVNVYAGHLGREDVRIILDTENYRIRREESLVRLAYITADKVRQRKSSVLLEPMNPFERRLIHTTLNDIADVETKSEGDGLYKQVRVIYKGVR